MNVLLEFIMFPEKLVGRSQFESTPHNPTSPFFFQLCFLRIGKNMWWLTKANFITHQNLRANHYPPSAWGSEPEPSLQKKNPRKTKHLKTPSFRELRAGTTRKPPPKPKAPPRPPATKPMPRDPALRRPSWRWRNQPSSGKWDAEAKKMKRASFHFTMMMQGTQQTKELNLRPGTFPTQPNCPTKKKKPPPTSCRYCWSCRYRWLCPSLDASYVSPTGKRLRPLQHRAVHGGCLPGETRVKDGDRQGHQDLGVVFGGCFFFKMTKSPKNEKIWYITWHL